MNENSDNKEVISKILENDDNHSNYHLAKSLHNSNMKEDNKNINIIENLDEKEIMQQINNQAQKDTEPNLNEKEQKGEQKEELKEEQKEEKREERTKEYEKTEYTKKIGNYILFDQIGMGTFSKVTKAIHLITSQQVAVKILDKEKIEDEVDLERIIREIEILKNIYHPNIAQMYETYSTIHNFYLMMEFVSGGDLFDYISENSCLSENISCLFFRQLISVLEYLISMGITHRDIKPENILLDEKHQNIKVIDFGLSNYCEDDELLGSSCGSPCYASPEMLSGNPYHGVMTDIWSAGVVLYSMLVGSLPFDDQELYNLYQQIKSGKFYLPSTLSLEAIDLLKRILQVDPEKRIGINDIKKHPWFNIEKSPMYKGINISKEKCPCNKDVAKFILENYFNDDKDINLDMIINMVEIHACNKYTSTYYLTKYNILEIDDEFSFIDDNYNEDKNKETNKNNINLLISNDNLKNSSKNQLNLNKEETNNNTITHNNQRKLLKCRTKDYIDNKYNKIKNKVLGILDNDDISRNYLENLNQLNQNEINQINEQEKEKDNNDKKNQKENGENKNKNNENNKMEKDMNDNTKNEMIQKEELNNITMQNEIYNKGKIGIINKKEKMLKKRNNKKMLNITNTDRTKLNVVNELKEYSYFNPQNNNKLYYNTIIDKNKYAFNLFKINIVKDKKQKIKSINNSYNKSLLNDRIINTNNNFSSNKKKDLIKDKSISINNKKANNISINNNSSEGYEKKQVSYIKKNNISSRISEKNNLTKAKAPVKENTGHFNFYVINNIINKNKDFDDKIFSSLDCDNKTILKGLYEFNKIKAFTNKKVNNIAKNKSKDNNHNFLSKIMKKRLAENSIKKHNKLKTEQISQFSLKAHLQLKNQMKMNDDINKIKVNLKTNKSYLNNNNKSPSKIIMTEKNIYKKDLKKVLPKLKLEGINNKTKNNISQKNNENNNIYNEIVTKNNYFCYTQNNINSNNNNYFIDNKNVLCDRSDSLSNNNINKTNKIYKRKVKNNCIITKNNIINNNYFMKTKNNSNVNDDFNILTHQRFLSSTLKPKLKTENNTLVNFNKMSNTIKDNMCINKKNKVLKNSVCINQNKSFINDYYSSQNVKNRNNLIKSEDETSIYKSMHTDNNSINKKNNKKIVKRTSHLGLTTKFNVLNNDLIWMKNNNKSHISNMNSVHSIISKQIKKENFINTNNSNQNIKSKNMLMKSNKNKNKNRNINNYMISNDSSANRPALFNTENNMYVDHSPYLTEKNFDNNNNSDKNCCKYSALKKNERKKNIIIF